MLAGLPGEPTPPPSDSLFWALWNQSTDLAKAACGTEFVQGIGNGTLDPVAYGGFNVNDAYYCFNGADDYATAATRTTDPNLEAYLQAKAQSYEKYNQIFPVVWHVKDAAGVVPFPVCVQYSEFETTVATQDDPIYALIVMLPCEYLWSWLAQQIAAQSPPGNLYQPWIGDNDDDSGAFKMGNFLYSYMQANPGVVDPGIATQLYRSAMDFELENFQAGTLPPG